MLKIYYPICCGMDVHKKMVVATIATTDKENITTYQTQKFSTMTYDLKNLQKWLSENNCKNVCMESTGKYWIPVFNILEDTCKIDVVHPKYVRSIMGKKTDIKDSIWIADIYKHGLIQGSFIPSKSIRQLRDLLRYRRKLVFVKNSEKNRFQNSLITSNIMISNLVSDTFGKSSLALINLTLNKQNLTENDIKPFVYRNVRASTSDILKSLDGAYDKEQKSKIEVCLRHYQDVLENIKVLDDKILELVKIYEKHINLICTIPGINLLTAIHIIAEIGIDMSVFQNSKKLCSWCGLTPQNNESAGKKKSVRISHGGNNIKPILIQSALTIIRSKNCEYFKNKYEDLKRKKGHKKAIIAIARMIVVCIYNILNNQEPFNKDIYSELNKKRFNSNQRNNNQNVENKTLKEAEAVSLLLSLGYTVTTSNK